jgi:hypothetical protein
MLETIRNMQDTKISWDELVDMVYPANDDTSDRQKVNRNTTIAAIERRINNEAFDLGYASLQRRGNRTITAWQALTGVQGMAHILRANNAPQVRQVERFAVSLAA